MKKHSQNLPTDLEILEEIYNRYYPVFISFDKDNPSRTTKLYIPINIQEIADHFNVDLDIIFGRLYYYLDQKYHYAKDTGNEVHLFHKNIGMDHHSVQFAMLSSILADLREKQNKHLVATWISIIAISISVFSLLISIFKGYIS